MSKALTDKLSSQAENKIVVVLAPDIKREIVRRATRQGFSHSLSYWFNSHLRKLWKLERPQRSFRKTK